MIKKLVILNLMIVGMMAQVNAQHNLTMYNMHTLPQRIQVNPAQIPDSRFFISMPGFSSVHMLYGNDGFKLKNLVSVDDSNRLAIRPLDFYNALNKNNRISMDVNYDIINFGFKVRKSYFTVSAGEKVQSQVSFPKDFMGLFIIGNAGTNLGEDLNFNFGFDVMAYNDISATYSRSFLKDKLRLGVKGSYLNGILNVNTEKSDLIFNTHPDDFHYTVRTDFKVNTSSIIDTLNTDFNADNFDYNVLKSRNRGMALSFGATYQIIPKVVLSASIVDLGYIDWKDNVQNYETADPNKKTEFYGLQMKDFFSKNPNTDSIFKDVIDTLVDKLKMKNTHYSYRTNLPTKFYLGGNFWLTKRHNFGVLFYGNYYQKKLNPAITLSYNGKITKLLGVSVSYSMINKSFVNGGVGLTLNGGPFQYYVVADNILGMIKYKDANTIDIRTGINFTFRRKDKQAGLSGKSKKLG
jgi:hypothetical protein